MHALGNDKKDQEWAVSRKRVADISPGKGLQMHMSENTLCTLHLATGRLEEATHTRGAMSSIPLAQMFSGICTGANSLRALSPAPGLGAALTPS